MSDKRNFIREHEEYLNNCPHTYSAEISIRIMKPRIKIIDTNFTIRSGGKISNQDIFSDVIHLLFDYYGDNIKKKQGDDDYANYVESDFDFVIGGNWFHKGGGTIMMQERGDDEFLFVHIKASKEKIKNPETIKPKE